MWETVDAATHAEVSIWSASGHVTSRISGNVTSYDMPVPTRQSAHYLVVITTPCKLPPALQVVSGEEKFC